MTNYRLAVSKGEFPGLLVKTRARGCKLAGPRTIPYQGAFVSGYDFRVCVATSGFLKLQNAGIWCKKRAEVRGDALSRVQCGASGAAACACAGRAEREASGISDQRDGREAGSERVGVGLRRRGTASLSSGAAAEGVAVWVRVGSAVVAEAGAARTGRPGISLFGGRCGAGSQDDLRVPAAAWAASERSVHGRAGATAGGRAGEIRSGRAGLDAREGERVAGPRHNRSGAASRAGP